MCSFVWSVVCAFALSANFPCVCVSLVVVAGGVRICVCLFDCIFACLVVWSFVCLFVCVVV